MRARAALDLGEQVGAMRRATEALEDLDPGTLPTQQGLLAARGVLDRFGTRRTLSTAHTVVAFAGATGSGKSSLVNAVSRTRVATVGARRPTTASPLAVLTGNGAAEALLDWLDVQQRHQVPDLPEGLILVDLPDIDSVHTEHHRRAEVFIDSVDVLVWVLDPQKYADAVVHARYLRSMSHHAAVTVVVLNQIDLLAPAEREQVHADLHARLVQDGLADAQLLAASARTGTGVQNLRDLLAEFVAGRNAAHQRLSADLAGAADAMERAYPPPQVPHLSPVTRAELGAGMSEAAGVDQVARAVAGSIRHRSRARTGWPLTRWIGKFRPDPLRRLHLPIRGTAEDAPVVPASSRPEPGPVARARISTALDEIGHALSEGSVEPWRSYLRGAPRTNTASLPDALDETITRALPPVPDRRWWSVIAPLHWVLVAMLAAGLVWLTMLAVLGFLQIPAPAPPELGPIRIGDDGALVPAIAWPTALVLIGGGMGLLLSLICRLATGVGARRRRRHTEKVLTQAVDARVEELVLAPTRRAIEVAETYREAIAAAQGRSRPGRRARKTRSGRRPGASVI